jgi:hypothetical protein
MTCRGRGCLEIKPSPNPFFQTSSADIGVNAHNQIDWKIDGKAPPFNSSAQHSDGNFLFLYSRESDVIGAKVPKPVMDQKKLLTKTEFLKKKREMVEATKSFEESNDAVDELISTTARAEAVLNGFQHNPKFEDPRYTTSNVSCFF